MVKTALVVMLAVLGAFYAILWRNDIRRRGAAKGESGAGVLPTRSENAIGFGTNFFDTLGIGSFATTTSVFKLWKIVDDRLIPGTLNVGHTLPAVAQALIYIAIVEVGTTTLVALIVAAVAGAWLGAGVVAGWPKRRVQVGMGCALLGAAGLMLSAQLNLLPGAGEALELDGVRLAAGMAGNFMLGSLMMLGIGLYAPCLIMISLLGMNPTAAFPIMMGSCAYLMPAGSAQFLRRGSYAMRPALGLTLGGVPAVLIAAYLVKSLPLGAVRWLVLAVVVYTAIAMLRSARADRRAASQPPTSEASSDERS